MGAVTIQQMADRISELLEERLRIKGRDLADKMHRAGRRLPRKVRAAGRHLAAMDVQSHNPKLLLQIDEEAVEREYDICVKYLTALNRRDRRKGVALSLATSILLSLLGVLVLFLAILKWRGYW